MKQPGMKNVFQCLVRSIALAAMITCFGYVFTHLVLKDPQKPDFMLFVFGAIPIAIYLPSIFSQSKSGALRTPKVIFRKVETPERKGTKEAANILPALSYVITGILIRRISSNFY